MTARGVVALAVCAVGIGGFAAAGTAAAEPDPPCEFRLSAPEVVQVSGVDMVKATMSPAACGIPANPYLAVVCLQEAGTDSARQCGRGEGPETAYVYHPYRPGATYTASGQGCAAAGNPPVQMCRSAGPYAATL